MSDRPYRSDRHQLLANTHPKEPNAWQQPSARTFAACQSGPCAKGKKICPSPVACLKAERAAVAGDLTWLFVLLIAIVVVLGIGSFLAWKFHP